MTETLAIVLAAVCVFVSAFSSGSEVALFSLRRVDREHIARSGGTVDRLISRMLERPRRLIATVTIGTETCNSLLAVIAFGVALPRCETWWGAAGVALGVSLPIVVLGTEITVKTLAGKAPLTWSRFAALPLAVFAVIVTPLRMIVAAATLVLLKPLGESVRARPVKDLSEAEFRSLIDAGAAQGQVEARERRLIHRVFEFHDKNVGQVMTPREKIFGLAYDLPAQRLVKEVAARGFSRVPIYQRSLDNIRGILNAKDLVRAAAGGSSLGRPLGELLHVPLFVPRTTPVKRLFLTFKQKKVHMAVVVSEYGKVLGLVTMDDLLAQIFGAIRDERAELQGTESPVRGKTRTPAVGTKTEALEELAKAEEGAAISRVLAPPPIHVVDEVTPPATDIADLAPPVATEDSGRHS